MTMLKRIACGIHASLTGAPSLEADTVWDALTEAEKAPYYAAALRMLTIIRTPTDKMLAEGNRRDMPRDAANVWERMAYRALYED